MTRQPNGVAGPGRTGRDAADENDSITRLVCGLVRAEHRRLLLQMAAMLGGDPAGYSSRRGHGPPGYADDAWKPIARQIGVRRGRWYYVTADALARYEAGERDAKPANDAPAEKWDPLLSLERARARRAGVR